tara:strand:+ start:915 stop:1241 length:327 start_codon:yes stop_codon:yes gene_type:complete
MKDDWNEVFETAHKVIDGQYKFNEPNILESIKKHIDNTYNAHYAHGKYQATDMIVDAGHGESFCVGNIMKYAMRYGKKDGRNVKDLLKIIHYAMIAIYIYDEEQDGRS